LKTFNSRNMRRLQMILLAGAATTGHAFALGGHLLMSQALGNIASEISGPVAYCVSLVMIVVAAATWYTHSHDMGMLGKGIVGLVFVAGVVFGGAQLLSSLFPGATGALI
jgi:type IV secretory pathway VirB2 component (pilin)